MAFDDQTRRRLFKTVTACRNLLTEDFDEQLRSRFGIYADEGRVRDLDGLANLDDAERDTALLLRERIEHIAAGKGSEAIGDAVRRVLREQAFTVLNRFAAVRMAEERGIISQSAGGGLQSNGFRIFERVAGSALGDQYERYLVYLDCLFDELSLDLGVLFDRADAMGLLFPGENALRELFDLLNDPEIAPLWAEDETIGWVYQYYNDPDERKKMRKESAAPRNSRELAVRNQFFTPRYVVEFLTDNTLGRIWYEMTKGETLLVDQCRYLVRRPCEFFLGGPDTLYWHDAAGTEEFHEFDRTGDPAHLPENPALGVVLGWAESLRRGDIETTLSRVGLDRDMTIEHVVEPLQAGKALEDLDTLNPALLIRALWYFQEQYQQRQGPVHFKDPVREDPIVNPIWQALRRQLQNPPEDLSQEELLKRPVFVPHRPIKDPREIRLLDPACGSMHFGLYAFDLFETIYEEAWARNLLSLADFGGDTPPFPHDSVTKKEGMDEFHSYAGGGPCKAATARVVILQRPDSGDGLFHTGPYLAPPEYTFRTEIDREMPWMDFDYQEALASEWISEEEGERLVRETDAFEHGRIDPLPPGEIEQRFCREVPKLIIEHNIHGVDIDPRAVQIAGLSLWLRAQKSWKAQGVRPGDRPQVRSSNFVCAEPMPGNAEILEEFTRSLDPPLLGELVKSVFEKMQLAGEAGTLLKIEEEIRADIECARKEWLEQQDDLLTRKDGTQEDFFDTAEQQVIDALRSYAEQTDADSCQRRLFADDAARGFAFIDLCRKSYDAVVMNPPFGAAAGSSLKYLRASYPVGYIDLYTSFIDRAAEFSNLRGILGAITSRTAFFLSTFEDWRRQSLLRKTKLKTCIDLGQGILDGAMVETAAYTLEISPSLSFSTFFDLRDSDDKRALLQKSVIESNRQTFIQFTKTFLSMPGATIAYSSDTSLLSDFVTLNPLSEYAELCAGSKTGDDEQFVRTAWEVPPKTLSPSAERTWRWLSKGGEFGAFYPDIHLVVDWRRDGEHLGFYSFSKRPREGLRWGPRSWSAKFVGRPGIVWPRRSQRGVSFRLLPADCACSDKSPIALIDDTNLACALVSVLNTNRIQQLASCVTTFGSYEMGSIGSIPVDLSERSELESLGRVGYRAVGEVRSLLETDPHHAIPNWRESETLDSLLRKHAEIIASNRTALKETVAKANVLYRDGYEEIDLRHDSTIGDAEDHEIIAQAFSELLGLAFGRWDIRYATGERQPPELPDPFDPLPVCPPGMLQNAAGLPAEPKDVPADYPLPNIPWSGILVDDENHPDDIVGRVREALRVVWGDRADTVEQEACEILGVKPKPRENLDALRVWFRDPNKFFKDHLARYSKSRRKAPIYWPLSTESCSYTVWIYYHRLDSQTLYTCVNDFVQPKREDVGREIESLRNRIGNEGTADERQRLEDLVAFQSELKTLHDRLLEAAGLPYRPDLNDGVQITAAPLWPCFRHKPWQTVLKKTWTELEKGKYDWAHLAMSIWPDRVVPKCAKDRSLAIAHGIEDLLWVPDLTSKKKDQLRPLKSPEDEQKHLLQAGHEKENITRAAEDVEAAEQLGLRDHLWINHPDDKWRRRLTPKEEIENEIARRRGR